jgi:excisionase family DNA binding protein
MCFSWCYMYSIMFMVRPGTRWMVRERGWVSGQEGERHMNRNLPRVAYRPREAAEVTGLSLRFLYYAIQHKDLPTVRVGRCRLITEKALREWLERKTEAPVETRG